MKDTNNKLFSEEDFDKPTSKRNWLDNVLKLVKSLKFWLGIAVIVVLFAIILVPKGCVTGGGPIADSLAVDTTSNDSLPSVVKDMVNSDSVKTIQKVIEGEKTSNPVTATENDKAIEKIPTQAVGNVSDDVTKEALSVIRGNYGNNPDRRRLLKERYQEIQNKVNEMYLNGKVK